jgi:hypothetical protein
MRFVRGGARCKLCTEIVSHHKFAEVENGMHENPTQYLIVGHENQANYRLSQSVASLYGTNNTRRFLELAHLLEFLPPVAATHPIVVCFDLFSFDPHEATRAIGFIRDNLATVVFCLYVDKREFRHRLTELPEAWSQRLRRYFRIFKQDQDGEFDLQVGTALAPATHEAKFNMGGTPFRRTPNFQKGIVESPQGIVEQSPAKPTSSQQTLFVSYARNDWDDVVNELVANLAKVSHKVWIDRHFLLGGTDWLDAVGAALRECQTLILVMTPDAMNSKYVKMEYRYFFHNEKPIIPVLCKQTDIPFELAGIQFIDCTSGISDGALSSLQSVLSKNPND